METAEVARGAAGTSLAAQEQQHVAQRGLAINGCEREVGWSTARGPRLRLASVGRCRKPHKTCTAQLKIFSISFLFFSVFLSHENVRAPFFGLFFLLLLL